MAREDFDLCTDDEVRSVIYGVAAVRAALWSKSTKKFVEDPEDAEGVAGVFRIEDLEDWFVMGIAVQIGCANLFEDLFASPLGQRFQLMSSKEVASCQ